MTRLALLSLLSVGLAAQAPAAQAPPASPAPVQAPAPVPVPTPEVVPEDQVLARIGSRIIYERDFEGWLKILAGQARFEQMSKAPGGLAPRRQQYLDFQVLAAKARKDGLQKLPAFDEELKVQQDQVLVKLLMNEEREGSAGRMLKDKIESPSEDEVKAYFEKNAQRYETPEKFTARHILVGVKGPRMGNKGLTEEEAKARIAKVQQELAAGKKFDDLAKEYSDDPSNKNNGGLIKDAPYGQFVPEFAAAVQKQEIGKVGEPVKTPFGYHLIVVESRTPKQPAVFEQVRDRVKQQMVPERREATYKAFLEQAQHEVDFAAGADAASGLPKAAAKPAPGKAPAKP